MTFEWTTFVFELVNFVVLVWILRRVVYRPLKRGIEGRRQQLADREAAATARAEEADARIAAAEARKLELERLRDDIVREATDAGAAERARIVEQAQQDAAGERTRVQRLLDAEREAALAWVHDVAVHRSTEIAGRLLMALAPDTVDDALRRLLLDEIARHPELQGLDEVEVRAARRPADDALEALRAALATDGRAPKLVFREDESLLAGLVVRAGDQVLDASIAGQLEAFQDQARRLLDEVPGG